MGNLARIFGTGNLHPRENFRAEAALVLSSELIIDCDGCSSFLLDLRGTFSGTIEVSGCSTVDNAIYTVIPVVPVNTNSRSYVASVVGAVPGVWEGKCGGYSRIRARCTALTSGTFLANLSANNSILDDALNRMVTTSIVTTVSVSAGAAATLTLPLAAGLKHYITYLRIAKFAAATLTAAAAPMTITTTNLPGSLAFSFPADAAPQGSLFPIQEDFAYPVAASSQGTNTTIVAPATTNVIWRMTAGYYLAP